MHMNMLQRRLQRSIHIHPYIHICQRIVVILNNAVRNAREDATDTRDERLQDRGDESAEPSMNWLSTPRSRGSSGNSQASARITVSPAAWAW